MADSTANPPSTAPRRPWYRLHFSTWVVALFGIVVAALLIVPGEDGHYPSRHSSDADLVMLHGWPFTFEWRKPGSWTDFYSGVQAQHVWNVFDGVKGFRPAILAADVLIATALVVLWAAAWEWRRRRRSKRFQFSLRSLFIVVTLLAAILGWWAWERRADHELEAHLEAIQARPSFLAKAQFRVPRFPLWFRAIVGDDRLNELGITRLHFGLTAIWSPATHEHIKYLLTRYRSEIDVELKPTPNDDELSTFLELERIEVLVIHDAPARLVSQLSRLPNLTNLHIGGHHGGALDDAGLIALAKMPSLRVLDIMDAHRITAKSLKQLAVTSKSESLSLWRSKLTKFGLASIASMPNLKELTLVLAPVKDDDLEALAGNDRIERLTTDLCLFTDRGLPAFRAMPHLKDLHLMGVALSDAGIAALRTDRPHLKVSYSPIGEDLKANIDDIVVGNTTRLSVYGATDQQLADLGMPMTIDSLALNSRYLTDAILAGVETLTKLKELDIAGSQITGKGLRRLTKLQALRTLTLDEEQIDDEAIAVLSRLPALKHIWIKLGLEPADSEKLKKKMREKLGGYDLHFDEPTAKIDPWE